MATKGKSSLAELGLKQLLEGMEMSHSQDIATLTNGHLNESKLWKPLEAATHKSWKSALKPNITLVVPSTIPKKLDRSTTNKVNNMKATLASFTTGLIAENGTPNTPNLSEPFKDKAYVEEINPADLKFNKLKKPKGWSKDTPLEPLKSTLYKDAITKKDQFKAIKQFKDEVFQTSRQSPKTNLGDTTVAGIEERLDRHLEMTPKVARGTNFHRVQAYGSAFEELIDSLPTFGYMLKTIKNEYDAYLSFLLDAQLGKHRKLHDQVTQLSSRGKSRPEILQTQIDKVNEAELEAMALLAENDRLRQELEQEEELSELPLMESETQTPQRHERVTKEEKRTLVNDVEDLNTKVLDKLDEVKRIKDDLHNEYVPAIVCNHLEQCIKDTEVDTQRLTSQKDYFNNAILEIEDALKKTIEYADTTEKDSSRIWETVQVKQDEDGNLIMEELDNIIDEEAKWNWYIS